MRKKGSGDIGTPVKVQEKAAPSPALASTKSALPQLEAPADGATLDNGRYDRSDYQIWDFSWRPVPHASWYRIYVKHPGALKPAVDEVVVEPHYRKKDRGYVVDRYRMGWTWKAQAYVGDEWGPWSETRTFDVEPLDTDPPMPRDGEQ